MNPSRFENNPPISLHGSSLLVRANEGRTLHAFGHSVVVLLDGKQTGEKFTAFLNISPPGCGPGATLPRPRTEKGIARQSRETMRKQDTERLHQQSPRFFPIFRAF
jgi:hypothetical protein